METWQILLFFLSFKYQIQYCGILSQTSTSKQSLFSQPFHWLDKSLNIVSILVCIDVNMREGEIMPWWEIDKFNFQYDYLVMKKWHLGHLCCYLCLLSWQTGMNSDFISLISRHVAFWFCLSTCWPF